MKALRYPESVGNRVTDWYGGMLVSRLNNKEIGLIIAVKQRRVRWISRVISSSEAAEIALICRRSPARGRNHPDRHEGDRQRGVNRSSITVCGPDAQSHPARTSQRLSDGTSGIGATPWI